MDPIRSVEELERVAFREALTAEEDDRLCDALAARAASSTTPKQRIGLIKQAAYFAARAFDKGSRAPAAVTRYADLLAQAQKLSPSDSFRRKLTAMRSALAGKDAHVGVLARLARAGETGSRTRLATDADLDAIECELKVKLPRSYREYLRKYAHRQVGAYEPYSAGELVGAASEARSEGPEPYYLPFLEDNADHFCFDMRGKAAEPPVIFRPHDGTSDATWANFADWVENCWLAELED